MQSQQLLWQMTIGMTKHDKDDIPLIHFKVDRTSLLIALQELVLQYYDQRFFHMEPGTHIKPVCRYRTSVICYKVQDNENTDHRFCLFASFF